MILRPSLAAALALALAVPAVAAPVVFAPPAVDASRYGDLIDFKAMAPKFLNKEGFLDQDFQAAVAGPSDVYTDFYGIQAVSDRTAAQIRRDFVPRLADAVASDDHSLTLRFKAGYTARFFPRSSFVAFNNSVPFSHAAISGGTWREVVANTRAFRATVKSAGLGKAYLIPNPLYPAEQAVARRLAADAPHAPVTADPKLETYDRSANAILLSPEGVHGVREYYDRLVALLSAHRFDWIGMEMLPAHMQPTLDDFTTAPEGSPRQQAARKALLVYFTDTWNGRAGPKTAPEDNYYFQLVDLARRRHARVIGIENVPMAYFFFRNGESAFGAGARNHQWAAQLPLKGHGVVFGGGSHFDDPRPINVQDFIAARNPKAVFVSAAPIKPRKQP